MRIGIDARELCGRPTGVGRYLEGLIREWAANGAVRRHEFVLYAPAPLTLSLDARRFATRLVQGRGGTWWEQVTMPATASRDHLDVFFAPAYSGPLRLRIPLVVAIHDVSFAAHPEWFRLREGARRRLLTRATARRARHVITISEFSRREIVERLGCPPSRVSVVPPGITSPVHGRSSATAPRVLFVGSIFNRRHVSDLVRGFGRVARNHPDARLDIVGDNRTYPHEAIDRAIAAEHLDATARVHPYVSDPDLRELYAGARAFAFLSEYEGLGLTPLEALAAGVPALLADTPVAHESCGDAALYVPPADARAIADALERLLYDAPTRERLLAAAPAALARYDWPRAAAETLAILERASPSCP